jgi:hypothetical protein
MSFTNTTTDLSNDPLPNTGAPENLLAAFWDDLDFRPASGSGRAYRYSDGTRFILSYVAVPRYSSGGPYTFQVILYPSGRILYQYLDMPGTRLNEATVGIQNAAKNDGLTVVYNADYVHDGLAVEIATIPDYLTVTPSSGTIPAGGSLDIAVNFNTAGLFGGVYDGGLRIQSNDPDEAILTVPTRLTAIGTPDIASVPASLDFGWQYVGLYTDRTVQVKNIGSDALTITGATVDNPIYSLIGASFPITIGNRGSATLTLRFAPTAACDPCAGVLHLASNDPDSPDFAVPLTGIGLIPPEIEAAPAALQAALATTLGPTALTTEKQLIICNTGGSDLNWTVEALSALPAAVQIAGGEDGKDDPGTAGDPVIAGHGGPDAFGYRWADSDDPLGPAFAWEDIAAVGTPIPLNGDDQNLGPFPLPFPFPFYGNTFTSFRISSNGWVSFTNTTSALSNYALPNTSAPENLLATFWDDLNFNPSAGSARAYYHYDGTKFIISFLDVPRYSSGGPYTFQILLYPSGTVDFQYLDMQGTRLNEATIGIQNATKDVGLTVVYNAAYVKNDLRVRFSNQPGWLTVAPLSGTTPAGECDTLVVGMNAAGLADGDYDGTLRIYSNDLDEPLTLIPVRLHVGVATALFDLDPNTLNKASNGNWVLGKVTPPGGSPPQGIVTSSVLLQRAVPVAPGAPISYTGPTAYYKFDRLALSGLLPSGNAVPVEVIGRVDDLTWFAAWDTIRVLKPKMTASALPEYGSGMNPEFAAGSVLSLTWTDPDDYAATYFDLWYSADGGEIWTPVVLNTAERSYGWLVPADVTEDGLIELVAYDELGPMGAWTSDLFSVMSAVTGTDGELPTVYDLRFRSANPARGAARFELALPVKSDVSVRVYDVRGRLVALLADGQMPEGRHLLSWGGEGRPGVYFVQAQAGEFSRNLRFVVVR